MKKFCAMLTVLILLLSGAAIFARTAAAAQIAVTLSSDDSVSQQAKQLWDYIEKLPEKDRRQWLEKLADMTREARETNEKSAPESKTEGQEDTVWVSKSGKRYHALPTCSGMKNAAEITRDEAVRRGLTPCKKCKPR